MSELKIDTRIIEKLWNGELYEAEVCRLSGESYQKKLKSLNETHKQLLEILVNGLKNQMITITSEIKSQLINWFVSQPAFIQALCPDFGWEV